MFGSFPGGLTTKIHALVDKKGRPIKLKLTAGQASDVASASELIADLPEDAMLIADKGYDANALREAVAERGAWANIPPKANRKDPICFSKYLYKARNLIERFFNKIKHFRRIATRYDSPPKTSSPPSSSPPYASGCVNEFDGLVLKLLKQCLLLVNP